MMKPHSKALIPMFFSLMIIVILLLAPTIPIVEVEVEGELRRFYNVPLNVEIMYTHSVERLPVIEILTVDSSCIKLSKIFWPGHGAGMPSSADDMGGVEVESEEALYAATLETCLGSEIIINTEHMVNGTVRIGDNIFRGRVEVRVARVSLVNYIFGRLG